MPTAIELYPSPLSSSTSKQPDQNQPLRTCHPAWDPKRNGLALAVVPENPLTICDSKNRQAITCVPDQSLYLINASDFKPARRSFITRAYQVFDGLQRVVQVCEEEEGIVHDRIQLPNGVRIPSTSQYKYYYRIGNQYIVTLKDYLEELQKADEVKNSEEIDLVLHMIHIFSLFVLVHVPADGRGDAIVAEEILDWVNRFNPQPPQEEGEELGAMTIPYEHVNFWPYIHACVIRGHIAQASALLKSYANTHNPTLNQLTTVTLSLMKALPRSTAFGQELEFRMAIDKFRDAVDRSLVTLDSEMSIIFETEKARAQAGESAFDEDDLIHFQASYSILLEILSGKEERIFEACYDWPEALGAYLLWVNPLCKRDDLPIVMRKVTADWPIDQTSNLELGISSILNGEMQPLVRTISQMDAWLSCHLVDLIDKLGIPLPDRSRGYYVGQFVDYLAVDQGLWRLMVAYLTTVDGTKEWIREILRRLVVDDLGDLHPPPHKDLMQLDSHSPKVTTRVSVLEMKSIYAECGMPEEMNRTAKIMARRLMQQRKYGAAIAYAVSACDLKLVSRICDCLLDEYVTDEVEFARLVDEIPSSLLHPTAPERWPNLFFERPSQQDGTEDGEEHQTPRQPNLNSSKLLFVSRYRDVHSYYSRGELKRAAEMLIELMTMEIAPRRWWAVCLIDMIPLLQDKEILVSLPDTYELLRCLEEITGPIVATSRDSYDNLRYLKRIIMSGKRSNPDTQNPFQLNPPLGDQESTRAALDELQVLRHALSKHLARALTSRH